jgi:hypothetical protein
MIRCELAPDRARWIAQVPPCREPMQQRRERLSLLLIDDWRANSAMFNLL